MILSKCCTQYASKFGKLSSGHGTGKGQDFIPIPKTDTIKDRNGMDITEAEDIKKRWQEYTEEMYKKDLHDPDNHNGVITHLEPDILECEVKWALGSIATKLVEVTEFQLSYFKS